MDTMLEEIEKNQFELRERSIFDSVNAIKKVWQRDYKWIHINLDIEEDIVYEISEDVIQVILDNLILNSIQQNDEIQLLNIFISAMKNDGKLEFEYRDNGKGLDDKYLTNPRKILEVHETTRKKGHGLGMWIVNNTCIMSGGEVQDIKGEKGFYIKFTLGGKMDTIKMIYIDDSPDISLSKYLDKFRSGLCQFDYSDIEFNSEEGYESLINNTEVRTANIIFIDSKLFENRNTNGKFTGEEFKIILKKHLPFIEVIVITQNEVEEEYETIAKYDSRSDKTAQEYYDSILPELIDHAVKNIFEYRKIASRMKENTIWEDVMIEKIENSLEGKDVYDELTKTDIDHIIGIFQELQEKVDR